MTEVKFYIDPENTSQRRTHLTVRVTRLEKKVIRDYAKRHNTTQSDLIRSYIWRLLDGEQKKP